MSYMKNDLVYLRQIKDAIRKIRDFTRNISQQDFSIDSKTQSAVIMQLILIGELAKKLSSETMSQIDLPWKEIKGFRNRAIHDYYLLDVDIVWSTIQEDIPFMNSHISDYLLSKQ